MSWSLGRRQGRRQGEEHGIALVATQTPGLRLRDTVTRRDIAEITASWTGVALRDLIGNDD